MSEIDEVRLTLRPGRYYGWTMYPGYFDRPYRSPVRIEHVDAREEGVFELSFLNIFYAAGVQRMGYLLRPLRWEKTYLMAEQLHGRSTTDRVVVIEQLDRTWIQDNVPSLSNRLNRLFDEGGNLVEGEFLRLLATAC